MPTPKNATAEDKRYLDQGDDLSDSTRRARWIHSTDEHEDHPGETLATRTREVIEAWATDRDGVPATVPGTRHDGRPGVLRLDFGGDSDALERIDWAEWFGTFEDRNLTFLYQEHRSDGSISNFFRLDNPSREDG
jgi:hypothetical protein